MNLETRRIVVSGCSSGGKSSLVAALGRRGFATVTEPGRRIVEGESNPDSPLLPWNDPRAFADAAAALAICDFQKMRDAQGPVFFDRGLIDALCASSFLTDSPLRTELAQDYPYNRVVFMAPPWADIYVTDTMRRHSFQEACSEYQRLLRCYESLKFQIVILPKVNVSKRVTFICDRLGLL